MTHHQNTRATYIRCPKCQTLNANSVNYCSNCGIPVGSQHITQTLPKPSNKSRTKIWLIPLVVFLISIVLWAKFLKVGPFAVPSTTIPQVSQEYINSQIAQIQQKLSQLDREEGLAEFNRTYTFGSESVRQQMEQEYQQKITEIRLQRLELQRQLDNLIRQR